MTIAAFAFIIGTESNISKTIKNDPLYIKKCNELYELKETVFRECDIDEFINSAGRELYEKLYKDFPFENYVI